MKEKTIKAILTVMLIMIFCTVMALVDGVFKANYFIKSIIKMVLFFARPAVYSFFDKDIRIKELFVLERSGIKSALILGVLIYVVIFAGYLLLKDVFDFSAITGALTGNIGVTRDNFFLVALYISFVNSLLEEFFFRGFAFLALKKVAGSRKAHIFSAAAFALYHIAIMTGWFSAGMFVITITGLFAGGLVLNYLNAKSGNIYTSGFVHMFANFAINTVGFMHFRII